MIERVEERFDLKPLRLIGDMAYGNAELLGWMVNDKGIAPHVPVWDRTQRDDDTLSSSDFQGDEQADEYRCPQGKALRKQRRPFKNLRTHITKAGTIIYRASQSDCANCPMKAHCCPNTPMRKIARSVHESAQRCRSRHRQDSMLTNNRGGIARKLRCCSHTSSASSSWIACASADPTAREMSSCSPPSRKTYDEWRSD